MPTLSQILGVTPLTFGTGLNRTANDVSLNANLTNLTDVTITSPSVDQIIKYNGFEWVNGAANATFTLDIDLSVIGSLADNATGILRKTGINSWTLDTNNYSVDSHSHSFSSLTATPTTLAGYGITDAAAVSHSHSFSSLTAIPTTLAGYGITDAAAVSHSHSFTLDNLTDVAITSPVPDQILKYNGFNWVNSTIVIGGGTSTGNVTAYEIFCPDWSGAENTFTVPVGWSILKNGNDLEITHNLNKLSIGWSGINLSTSPNVTIYPTASRNMRLDNSNKVTILNASTLVNFRIYLSFI